MKTHLLLETAEAVLATMRKNGLIDESRTGGYMTVLSLTDRPPTTALLVAEIGELTDPEKIKKYHDFSREKADRLRLNIAMGHSSSWQSRNPDENHWGGAIRAGGAILSFSGLPELADEALTLEVARRLGMLSHELCLQIAQTSNNEIFHRPVD